MGATGTMAIAPAFVGSSTTLLAIGAAALPPAQQDIVVNIGGRLEGPSNAIILQTGQINGSTTQALAQATEIAKATGQQVVLGMGNAIPFQTGSVNQVIVNNVPIGTGSGMFGPWIATEEITRILADWGVVIGDSAENYYKLIKNKP